MNELLLLLQSTPQVSGIFMHLSSVLFRFCGIIYTFLLFPSALLYPAPMYPAPDSIARLTSSALIKTPDSARGCRARFQVLIRMERRRHSIATSNRVIISNKRFAQRDRCALVWTGQNLSRNVRWECMAEGWSHGRGDV